MWWLHTNQRKIIDKKRKAHVESTQSSSCGLFFSSHSKHLSSICLLWPGPQGAHWLMGQTEQKNQSLLYLTSKQVCVHSGYLRGPQRIFGRTLDLTFREEQELREFLLDWWNNGSKQRHKQAGYTWGMKSGSVRPLMTGGERETESRIQTRIGLIIISTLNINRSKWSHYQTSDRF